MLLLDERNSKSKFLILAPKYTQWIKSASRFALLIIFFQLKMHFFLYAGLHTKIQSSSLKHYDINSSFRISLLSLNTLTNFTKLHPNVPKAKIRITFLNQLNWIRIYLVWQFAQWMGKDIISEIPKNRLLCNLAGNNSLQLHYISIITSFSIFSKPLNYAIALNELGSNVVHKYVGQEPSGRKFNDLDLDYNST